MSSQPSPSSSSSPGPRPAGGPGPGMIRRRRVASSARTFRAAAITLAVIAVLAAAAAVLYPVARRYRARAIARQVLLLIEAGRLDEARLKMPAIVRLAENDTAVLRALAHFTSAQNSPNALLYWEKLRASESVTTEDLLGFIAVALDAGRTDLSAPVVIGLIAENPRRVDVLQLGMRHLETAGYADRAIELGRKALAIEPFNPKTERMLGQLMLTRNDPALAEQAKSLLWSVALLPGQEREAAISSLASYDKLTPKETADLISLLEPESKDSQIKRLLLTSLKWRSNPAAHPALLADISGWLQAEYNTTNFSVIASWATKNAPEAIPAAIPESCAATNQLALLHLSEALAELGRWPELHGLMDKYQKKYPLFAMDMLLSREAAATHQNSAAEKHLLSASQDAERDARQLILAANYAESMGYTNTALQIWDRVLNVRERSVVAASQILRLSKDQDDLTAEQRALHRLASQASADSRLAAESAERDLLVNVDVEPALKAIERQIASEPNEVRWRFAAALADLRRNNPSGALARIEQIEMANTQLPPRSRAIYAAVLGANQQREAARRMARQLAGERLKSQERELIQPYL